MKFFICSLIFLSSIIINPVFSNESHSQEKLIYSCSDESKKTDYIIVRELRSDGLWWIVIYDEYGNIIDEFIDPDQ